MRLSISALCGGAAAVVMAAAALWSSGLLAGGGIAGQRQALMTELGTVSRTGQGLRDLTQAAVQFARRAPLASEPFLVAGAVAEFQQAAPGRSSALYEAALARDPRSKAAHFMLAREAATNKNSEAVLEHAVALARLSPGAAPEVSKFLLGLASDPKSDAVMRRFLRDNPGQADGLFRAMAAEPRLADRLFALAPRRKPNDPLPPWLSGAVTSLLAAGDTPRAAEAWLRYGKGGDPRTVPLRDPGFRSNLPAPFGWSLEPQDGGTVARGALGLETESYGSAPVRLAWQGLLLGPGQYRLESQPTAAARLLEWRVACADGSVATVAAGTTAVFAVPSGCAQQRIELWTRPASTSESTSATIRGVQLTKVGP